MHATLAELGMVVHAILAELGMVVQAVLAELGMVVQAVLAELGMVVHAILAPKMWKPSPSHVVMLMVLSYASLMQVTTVVVSSIVQQPVMLSNIEVLLVGVSVLPSFHSW